MEQDQEKNVERSSSRRNKWIVPLVIAVIVLAAGCVVLFLWKSNDKEQDDGGKIGYDTNAVVVTDEDELQKMVDEMYNNEGEISLATTKKAMVTLDDTAGTEKVATYKIFGSVASKPAKAWTSADTVDFKIVYQFEPVVNTPAAP